MLPAIPLHNNNFTFISSTNAKKQWVQADQTSPKTWESFSEQKVAGTEQQERG